MHFLAAGVAAGESVVFLNQSGDQATIQQDASAFGIAVEGVEFLDVGPDAALFTEGQSYDVFTAGDVERDAFTKQIVEHMDLQQPTRVFLDAMTQLRHLSNDVVEFRRQAQAFLQFLVGRGATVLFTSGAMGATEDGDLQFMSSGIVNLEYTPATGRQLSVSKFRGSDFRSGRHSLKVTPRGVEVYPRLMPDEYRQQFTDEQLSAGIPELDELLGGGLERGTVTFITGPTGIGRTTLGMQFVKEAAGRGERSVVYTFEEATATLLRRSAGVNIPVAAMTEHGTLSVVSVEPLRYTPDEFATAVRREVEERHAKIVMIDSLSGYRLSLQGEDLGRHVHALCQYLRNTGVTVIVVNETASVLGHFSASEGNFFSYLADNILFLRYVELDGELRRVIGVLKKRMSGFEKTLRELTISRYGIKIGPAFRGFRGVLSGAPEPTVEASTRPPSF
jgi:circadian clock protein KaiC